MDLTALLLLCLAPVFTLCTQELVEMTVSPKIVAKCGKRATLHCKVSSAHGVLSIKHMEWSHSRMSLCSVDSEGNISYNKSTIHDFYCEYKEEQLSLVFRSVEPEEESGESASYGCKVHSNKGAPHKYTAVELEECAGTVHGVLKHDGPSCTFSHVHPDGDVLWFLGSRNLSAEATHHHTTKRVEKGGWLTIHSHLRMNSSSEVPFTCFLRTTRSGRHIASALIDGEPVLEQSGEVSWNPVTDGPSFSANTAAKSHQAVGKLPCVWCISLCLLGELIYLLRI